MAPIQFGVLMIPYQIVDAAMPLDVLSTCSKPLVSVMDKLGVPQAQGLTSQSIDIQFHHINVTHDPVELTAGMRILPSTTCAECPPLDYLLVGGPDTSVFQLSDEFAKFIRKHIETGGTLFTTCTGSFAIAPSGVLDGKNATVNHGLLEIAKQVFPKVNWKKEQWVVDGKIWTAGGACAGMDMMAHWVIENYGMRLASLGFMQLDYEPRDVKGNRVLPQAHGVEA